MKDFYLYDRPLRSSHVVKRHDLVVARHHVSLSIENGEGFFDMVILGIF
jgi:hypothetical protein